MPSSRRPAPPRGAPARARWDGRPQAPVRTAPRRRAPV